jgi:thioredoxin 1
MSYAKHKDLPFAKEISVENVLSLSHRKKIVESSTIAVIDIYGTWCGPCTTIAPLYGELARKYNSPGNVRLVKEDVDKKWTNVPSVPTFQIFFGGKMVHEINGADIENLENTIISLISQIPEVKERDKHEEEAGDAYLVYRKQTPDTFVDQRNLK